MSCCVLGKEFSVFVLKKLGNLFLEWLRDLISQEGVFCTNFDFIPPGTYVWNLEMLSGQLHLKLP
jgi:hypothetical protein